MFIIMLISINIALQTCKGLKQSMLLAVQVARTIRRVEKMEISTIEEMESALNLVKHNSRHRPFDPDGFHPLERVSRKAKRIFLERGSLDWT